jgi:hypothetical protein
LNHDATPLSDLVSAPEAAATGGTTFSSRVVSGVSGVVVVVVVLGATAATGLDVVDVVTRVVVVLVGAFFVVVVVARGRVVVVVAEDWIWRASSLREMAPATVGDGVWGHAAEPAVAASDAAAVSTATSVDPWRRGWRRASTPATRTTRQNSAT